MKVFHNVGSFVYTDLIFRMNAIGSFENTTFRMLNKLIILTNFDEPECERVRRYRSL